MCFYEGLGVQLYVCIYNVWLTMPMHISILYVYWDEKVSLSDCVFITKRVYMGEYE